MGSIQPITVALDGAEVELRSPAEGDAPRVLDHAERSLGSSPNFVIQPGELDMTVEREAEWIRDHLDNPGKVCIVAEHTADRRGPFIGLLNFVSEQNRRRVAHRGTFGVGVLDTWRGRGVGRALIEALLDWARAHPTIRRVDLGVLDRNHGARRLYERLGFTENARQPDHFRLEDGTYAANIEMVRWVKPRD